MTLARVKNNTTNHKVTPIGPIVSGFVTKRLTIKLIVPINVPTANTIIHPNTVTLFHSCLLPYYRTSHMSTANTKKPPASLPL